MRLTCTLHHAEDDPLVAVPNETYFEDVLLQMESSVWAERFNKFDPPKHIKFIHAHLIEVRAEDNATLPPPPPDSSGRRSSFGDGVVPMTGMVRQASTPPNYN